MSPEDLHLTAGEISLLQERIPSSCSAIRLFARGKRGVIFKAEYRGKTVVIKVPRPGSQAASTMELETRYLQKVNELGIGPQLYSFSDDYVMMDFISGTLIGDFFQDDSVSTENVLLVIKNVFSQLQILDRSRINKFELTNPYKHIIVKEDFDVVLIDFERARFTVRPKNVTQFAEYLTSSTILPLLQKRDILLDLVKFKSMISEYSSSGELFLDDVL